MARMHLGSFGTSRAEVDADFDYFGETIRVHPDASDLHQAELMIIAGGIDLGDIDMDDPASWTPQQHEANDAAVQALQGQIHPEDWDLFFTTAKRNRQQTMDLMAVSEQIASAVAGFPTGQPSGSSPGQPSTPPRSKADSSSRAPGRAERVARKGLRALQERPDLQVAVVNAYEEARDAG
jgi:hypothetical protein